MLRTVLIILLALGPLGLASYTSGGFIHSMLAVAIFMFLIRLM